MKSLVIVIYHDKDLDGFCSGSIARMFYESQGYEVRMIGWNYGDKIPKNLSEACEIAMVDITFPVADMVELSKEFGSMLKIIDHHVSFNEDFMEVWKDLECVYVYDNEKAACELVWGYYFSNVEQPTIVDMVAVWDIHRKDTKLYQTFMEFDEYAAAQKGLLIALDDPGEAQGNYEVWKYMLTMMDERGEEEWVRETLNNGYAIIAHQRFAGKLMSKNGKELDLQGVKFMAYNSAGANKYVDAPPECALCYYFYDGGKWVYSLRQNEDKGTEQDILSVARHYGGGGHKNACGFSRMRPPFFKAPTEPPRSNY